ncbi:MAG: Ig-like domain-containing protein [Microgenomates group bacterium]
MRRTILLLVALLILLLSLGGLVFFISQRTTFFGRAYTPRTGSSLVSVENSYLFASPLAARADGQEKIRLTVFLLDSSGRGVAGEAVFLGQDERLNIYPTQPLTDDLGRAFFDISATTPGEYLMEARVGNKVLPQRVKISFF